MSALPTRSKDTIVATIAAAMQGRVAKFLNFAVGSVFLAIAEAQAGVSLWLQAAILRVLKTTRASTSEQADLDSFVADYGVARLAAAPATGGVTFTRFTAGPSAVAVPVGTLVQTADGSQRFEVYADSLNAAYVPAQESYVMPPGLGSVTAPVRAVVGGADGNVGAGAVSLLASSLSGVDNVVNPVAFTNGSDAESDEALRDRFKLFFDSLSKGTDAAIRRAIADLGVNLEVQIIHADPSFGQPYVTVVVDDGSGHPPDDLVQRASAAVGAVRAAGVWVPVIGASTLEATVSLQIEVAPGFYAPDVVSAVAAALTLYVNDLGLGVKLRYTRLEQVAYDASPGVTNVTAVSLNGGTADLLPRLGQTVKLAALTVN